MPEAEGATPVPVLHSDGRAAGKADKPVVEGERAGIFEGLRTRAGTLDEGLLHLRNAPVTARELGPDAMSRADLGRAVAGVIALDDPADPGAPIAFGAVRDAWLS